MDNKQQLESALGEVERNKRELDKLLDLVALDAKIRQGEVKLPEPKPLEELVERVKRSGKITKEGKLDGRAAAGKRRAKKNTARRKKTAKQQRWRRSWKERALSKALGTPEGAGGASAPNYWLYVSTVWKRKKRDWSIPEQEWLQAVQPHVPYGTAIELRRYDTSKPTTLGNIIVYDSSNGSVLFDGAEWLMKEQGYML